ncbi:substrate-specific activator of APC-dependent proteolysis [Coemansia sp. RSA 2618]|nr:substrate-specific activator of APC-dependent proteolysis [Coemansia sp. RSA 2618]
MWDEEFGKRVRAASAQKKDDSETSGLGPGASRGSSGRGRTRQAGRTTVAAADDVPGSKRTARAMPAPAKGKHGARKNTHRPPVPPRSARHAAAPAAKGAATHDGAPAGPGRRAVPQGSRVTGIAASHKTRATNSGAHTTTRHRHSRLAQSSDEDYGDGCESPTLEVEPAEGGVVTRSMARRMQTQDPRRGTKPALVTQSSSESTSTVATALSRTHSSEEAHVSTQGSSSSVQGFQGQDDQALQDNQSHQDTPENHFRHVRRSPQFNYDRFIPARSPDADLRRYETGGAASPAFSRKVAHIEQRVQLDEANRTYDALLRAELLHDRAAVDDFGGRRLRSSSPPAAARPASRRELYSSSPNQLPSLVPWSGGAPSSRPTTPPHSPPHAPVFTYRSPRKTSLGSPASMPLARNLFGRASPVHEVYQQSTLTKDARRILSPRPAARRIAKDPVKVLDAPGIRDDYYLNLMDWSSSNRVAVALNSEVYVWDAQSSQTSRLCDVGADGSEWVTSVGWAENGKHLAVGLNSGAVQIWDVNRARRVRTFAGHTRRVGAVHWNQAVVSTGSRDKRILNYDSRARQGAIVSTYYGHSQEVCGLRWSPDRTQLASGGNDNMLLIWDTRYTPLDSRVPSYHPDIAAGPRGFRRPLFRLTEHSAAVKALAWSPAQSGLLASAGGTDDRCIRLWDTQTGRQQSSHDTRSQVCNLSWAHDGSELVSTHGYSENHVIVWKYPAMQPTTVLTGHTKRVLYLAHSPDGQTIATAAGDETIRFWEIFPKDISSELGAQPASMAQTMRSPGTVARAAAEPGIILDDLAHIR